MAIATLALVLHTDYHIRLLTYIQNSSASSKEEAQALLKT